MATNISLTVAHEELGGEGWDGVEQAPKEAQHGQRLLVVAHLQALSRRRKICMSIIM